MKTNSIGILLAMVVVLGFTKFSCGQNFFLEVFHAETYRPVSNATVELRSELVSIVVYSSPAGTVMENIPAGVYRLEISRSGFETHRMTDVRILGSELTTMSVYLKQADRETTGTGIDLPGDSGPSAIDGFNRSRQKAFFDVSMQVGNIQAGRLGLGVMLFRGFYAELGFAFSRQKYTGSYFVSAVELYPINFHNLHFGLGYDIFISTSAQRGIFISPRAISGIEVVHNNELIGNDLIGFTLSTLIKPELRAGYYINRLGFFVGANFSHWIQPAFTEKRVIIRDASTGDSLDWGEDLFENRKGLGIVAGIMYGF